MFTIERQLKAIEFYHFSSVLAFLRRPSQPVILTVNSKVAAPVIHEVFMFTITYYFSLEALYDYWLIRHFVLLYGPILPSTSHFVQLDPLGVQ